MLFYTSTSAQSTFTVYINKKEFKVPEQQFNDMFGYTFSTMVQKGVTKEKYFDLWVKTFNEWKARIKVGAINYETMGSRLSDISASGFLTEEYTGRNKDGKPATGNPHKEENIAKRISILNYYFPIQVIYTLTGTTVQ
jgi:hypothetical protein